MIPKSPTACGCAASYAPRCTRYTARPLSARCVSAVRALRIRCALAAYPLCARCVSATYLSRVTCQSSTCALALRSVTVWDLGHHPIDRMCTRLHPQRDRVCLIGSHVALVLLPVGRPSTVSMPCGGSVAIFVFSRPPGVARRARKYSVAIVGAPCPPPSRPCWAHWMIDNACATIHRAQHGQLRRSPSCLIMPDPVLHSMLRRTAAR